MKRYFAFLLAVIMLCGLFVVPAAAARNYVFSPEYSDKDPEPKPPVNPEVPEPEPPANPEEPVVPEDPKPDTPVVPEDPKPDTPVVPEEPLPDSPVQPQPTSPQTGYSMGISSLAVVAVLSGAAAVISGKKLCKR